MINNPWGNLAYPILRYRRMLPSCKCCGDILHEGFCSNCRIQTRILPVEKIRDEQGVSYLDEEVEVCTTHGREV